MKKCRVIFPTDETEMKYIITDISRNGCEQYSSTTIFKSIEDTVTYIRDVWYDQFCTEFDYPDAWDADDMGCSFPTKEEFALEKINEKIRTHKGGALVIFGPRSDYCAHVPSELLLTMTKN